MKRLERFIARRLNKVFTMKDNVIGNAGLDLFLWPIYIYYICKWCEENE